MNAAIVWIALLATPAASPGSVLVPTPVETGEASPLAKKMVELVRVRLEARGIATVTAEEALVRATGEGESTASVSARAALRRGKDEYLQFELDKALKSLSQAHRGFQRVLLESGVFEPFAETLAYLGATHLALGNASGAEDAFVELIRVRPTFELDAAVYPPEVLSAYAEARAKTTSMNRAALNVLSAPPLARVFIDGGERGQTPLTVQDLIVGPHAVRVEVDGRLPWWGMVEVLETGTRVKVRLEQDLLQTRLEGFSAVIAGRGTRDDVVAQGRQLANAARTNAVIAIGFVPDAAGFVVSAAWVPSDGEMRIVWTVVDHDFFQAEEAAGALVTSVLATKSATPVFVPIGTTPAKQPDFDASVLGLPAQRTTAAIPVTRSTPSGGRSRAEVAVLPPEPTVVVEPEAGGIPGWVWIASGTAAVVVIADAAAGAGGYYWVAVPAPTQQEPDTVSFDVGISR